MELNEIRNSIDSVDEQLLKLFLNRMDLSEQVAAYKQAHSLPLLNKTREREILARVTEQAGDRESYAYQLFTTLFELSKARQGELYAAPSKVRAQVEHALAAPEDVFPRSGIVACQGVEGSNSQAACDKLLPRGNIVYVKALRPCSTRWNQGCAVSACSRLKTARTVPSVSSTTFFKESISPSSAARACASGMN